MNDFRLGSSSSSGNTTSNHGGGLGNNESGANSRDDHGDGFLSWARTVLSAAAARESGGLSGAVGGGGAGFHPSLFQSCHFGDGGSATLFQRCHSGGSSDGSGTLPGSAGRVLDLVQPQLKSARVSKSRSSRKRSKSTEAAGDEDDDHDPVTVDGGNVEDVLATEFGKLSIEQQQQLEKDIVGDTLNIADEDPEFVQQCLEEMDDEIKKITAYHNNTKDKATNSVDKTPYERAMFLAPNRYLTNTDFRLMFLRADEFDPKLAAQRIVKFFQMKKLLFGESKLCEPITIDDMLDVAYDDDDTTTDEVARSTDEKSTRRNVTREIFLSGAFQTLPCTDRSGRPVTFFAPQYGPIKRPGLHLVRAI